MDGVNRAPVRREVPQECVGRQVPTLCRREQVSGVAISVGNKRPPNRVQERDKGDTASGKGGGTQSESRSWAPAWQSKGIPRETGDKRDLLGELRRADLSQDATPDRGAPVRDKWEPAPTVCSETEDAERVRALRWSRGC